MDDDRARTLLTESLSEVDANRRYAERNRADTAADPDVEGVLGLHPGDQGTDLADAESAEMLGAVVDEQRRQATSGWKPGRRPAPAASTPTHPW